MLRTELNLLDLCLLDFLDNVPKLFHSFVYQFFTWHFFSDVCKLQSSSTCFHLVAYVVEKVACDKFVYELVSSLGTLSIPYQN